MNVNGMVEIVVVQLVYHQHMIVTQPHLGVLVHQVFRSDANDDCCDDNNCHLLVKVKN